MKNLTFLLLLSAALPLGAAQIDTVAFSPNVSSIVAGDTLQLEIDIGPLSQRIDSQTFQLLSNLYAWSIEIDFDPTVFQALNVNEGTFLPSTGATNFFPGLVDNAGGSISFISESLSGLAVGADTALSGGSLMTAEFQAIAPSPGSTFSIAPGSCFQNYLDIATFGCTISTWLDTSATAQVTVTAPGSGITTAPEPSTLALLLAGLIAVASVRLAHRKNSLPDRGVN